MGWVLNTFVVLALVQASVALGQTMSQINSTQVNTTQVICDIAPWNCCWGQVNGFGTCGNNLIPTNNFCLCEAGNWQDFSSWTGDHCVACSPGTFYPFDGCVGNCFPCSGGTYAPASGSTGCTNCSPDTYQPIQSGTSCAPCPPGWTTNGAYGQAGCTACGKQGCVSPGVAWPNGLSTNQYMRENDYIPFTSSNEQPYFATLQVDGHFCIYAGIYPAGRQPPIWCSNNAPGPDHYFAVMQGDSNVCVYHGTGPSDNRGEVWCSSNLIAGGGYTLTLGRCGELTAQKGDGYIYWRTPADVNGCAFIPHVGVAWPNGLSTNQFMRENDYIQFAASNALTYVAVLQGDGNFCVYPGGYGSSIPSAVWCQGNAPGTDHYYAILQNDGNFCVNHGIGPLDHRGLVWCSYNLTPGDVYTLTLGRCGVLTAASNGTAYWKTPAASC